MSELKHWVWLSGLAGVSGASKLALLEHFGSPGAVYFTDPAAYGRLAVATARAGRSANPRTRWLLSGELTYEDAAGERRDSSRPTLSM